jgi:hypothetical protein
LNVKENFKGSAVSGGATSEYNSPEFASEGGRVTLGECKGVRGDRGV